MPSALCRVRPSDFVVAGRTYGKVKAMLDEGGGRMSSAGPATPVRIAGLKELPRAGDELIGVASEVRAREVYEFRALEAHARELAASTPRRGRRKSTAKRVPLVLKASRRDRAEIGRRSGRDLRVLAAQADTAGALEAAREGVSHFPTERVELQLVRASVGALHEVRADQSDRSP